MMQRVVVLFAGLALSAGPARADDWPEFRGPTGQGIARDGSLPVEWSQTKNVAWRRKIPGGGWSSPVVVDGRIYLTTAVPVEGSRTDDQSLDALCLEARTGKVVWQREVFRQDGATAPRPHQKNTHATPTPLVHDGRLYVHFGHQGTACLDLAGKVLWRNTGVKYEPIHGNGSTPILVDDALVFSCDGGDTAFVVALDRNTGTVLWKTDRKTDASRKFSFTTPLLITVKGTKQVVSPGSDMVGAYDPQTGREIWRVRYTGYSVIPRPVFGHGLVFVCTGFQAPALLAIRPDGQGDVTETNIACSTRKGVPHTPSPLLVGDDLFMVSDTGTASCLDARTGKVHWQQRIGGNYSASPLYGDGKVYFQAEEGTAVVIRAAREFKRLARNDMGERTLASYAAADGALFIRTREHLYRIQAP
jgi:outer membrane protein assembly factor BamB